MLFLIKTTQNKAQITITKPFCQATPGIFKSVSQSTEHKMKIDIVHSHSSSGNSMVDAASSAAGESSGTMRYELDQAYITSQDDTVHQGEIITIECAVLTKTYNPPLKSSEIKSSSGYDFVMLKPV